MTAHEMTSYARVGTRHEVRCSCGKTASSAVSVAEGTTAEACVIEGFRCIAIEREAAYLPLIVARLSKPIQPDLFGGMADEPEPTKPGRWPTNVVLSASQAAELDRQSGNRPVFDDEGGAA